MTQKSWPIFLGTWVVTGLLSGIAWKVLGHSWDESCAAFVIGGSLLSLGLMFILLVVWFISILLLGASEIYSSLKKEE